MDQAEAASAARNPLPGTFRGFDLNLQSDRRYDLDSAIPDVIGLRAIQPDAAVIKVMSIPDNCCIRVVIPDDHVHSTFHEIIIHDMEEELSRLPPSGLARSGPTCCLLSHRFGTTVAVPRCTYGGARPRTVSTT